MLEFYTGYIFSSWPQPPHSDFTRLNHSVLCIFLASPLFTADWDRYTSQLKLLQYIKLKEFTSNTGRLDTKLHDKEPYNSRTRPVIPNLEVFETVVHICTFTLFATC